MNVPGFEVTAHPLSESQIAGAEKVLGVCFPFAYRQLVLKYNNSYGEAVFPIPEAKHPASIGHWLSLLPWDTESMWSALSNWKEHELPEAIVPIAQNGGGDYLCLDFRSEETPRVVMWYHELQGSEGLCLVADSFEGFLRTLYVDEA